MLHIRSTRSRQVQSAQLLHDRLTGSNPFSSVSRPAGDEWRTVVGNDSRFNAGMLLLGTFQNDLGVSLGHRLPQVPMNRETAVAVQDAAQAVERRANVQAGNIDMPMLVRLRRARQQ
jgi:hypothetical protein